MKKMGRKARKKPPPRGAAAARPSPEALHYKVVELSTVDEGSLERAVNTWIAQGWTLENVQFAMRESSKRPAMAFVFFTRAGGAAEEVAEVSGVTRLEPAPATDAWARLAALAAEGDEP
jgi:hypothetical protein